MKGKKKWRLSKTLSRHVEIRPLENEDVKYAWAAYKQGKLKEMGLPDDLDAAAFKSEFEKFVLTRAHAAWTVIAETPKGLLPVGIAFGNWGPPFMIMNWMAWLPWASKRNIIEGTVAICNQLRKQFPLICMASDEDKKLYETCMMHGIVHRIGTSHSLGVKMTVFESRART